MRRIKFIALKELYHILRDPRSLTIVIVMPIMMTFLYGYATNLDIKKVVISVIDQDQSVESHSLQDAFYQSTYFERPTREVDLLDPEELLKESDATAVLIINPGFSDALRTGQHFSLGMVVDGSDNTLSAAVQNYANVIVNRFMADRLPPGAKLPGVEIARQVLYNPDLKSPNFFVPGLVAIILLMISALLTSITIAREKETGTMEQLLTTPVTPFQILVGKVLPYVAIAFLDGLLVLILARFLFQVPFVGSRLLMLGFGFIYVVTSLSLGILISSLVKTQQVAMMFALVTTLLPSVMLTGFVFPIRNMPIVLQALTHIVPARYFVTIIRGIMLKGAGLQELVTQGVYLVILMSIIMLIASKTFKTRVE